MFFEFIIEQWILAAAWMTLLMLLLQHESRKSGKAVSPQQLSDLINKQDGVVVDVRDASEFRQGHIVDAVNIPLRDVQKRCVELKDHKEKPVIVVCKVGQHASSASKQFKAEGFESVYKLTGGISEWTASSLPLVK